MKQFFAYIRVSTAKQGEHGVSLPQQREAIQRYAKAHDLQIVRWFEEQVTAAKRGRPQFSQLLNSLRHGKASGVVIHKIDRSARNLKDWSDLGELIDSGIDVRFANESLDLQSRGGRLSADIQAVVAADYIRNLREETRKGFYGRLKQGLYPRAAPLGYLDVGPGKPKIPDPVAAPLIRRLFDLYASGTHSLTDMVEPMHRLGLRTRTGKKVVKSVLSRILDNSFYTGIIYIKKAGETYQGVHQPLISAALFQRARDVASGRFHGKTLRHNLSFRRLVRCGHCGYMLVGELRKAHVYYRCHTRGCPTKTIRQKQLHKAVLDILRPLSFTDEERTYLTTAVQDLRQEWEQTAESLGATLRLTETQLSDRLNRLTDAYLDGDLEKEVFEERKKALLLERQKLKEMISGQAETPDIPAVLEKFLELAGSAYLQYKIGFPDEQRELLEIVTSNRVAHGRTPVFTLDSPFQEVANRTKSLRGSPHQNAARTWKDLLSRIAGTLREKHIPMPKTSQIIPLPPSNTPAGHPRVPISRQTSNWY